MVSFRAIESEKIASWPKKVGKTLVTPNKKGGVSMDSMNIPLWIKMVGLFLSLATVFLLAAREIVFEWILDRAKRMLRLQGAEIRLGQPSGTSHQKTELRMVERPNPAV
jgi:hypothetical protein